MFSDVSSEPEKLCLLQLHDIFFHALESQCDDGGYNLQAVADASKDDDIVARLHKIALFPEF